MGSAQNLGAQLEHILNYEIEENHREKVATKVYSLRATISYQILHGIVTGDVKCIAAGKITVHLLYTHVHTSQYIIVQI